MYIELPNVDGTPASRIAALKEARELLKGEPKVAGAALFNGPTTTPGEVAGSTELVNLATYIETGHSYFDTHPTGKRRPKITNVTVVAPVGGNPEQLEHFLEHVKDGSFVEFLERMKKTGDVDVDDLIADLLKGEQPEPAEDEKSPEND